MPTTLNQPMAFGSHWAQDQNTTVRGECRPILMMGTKGRAQTSRSTMIAQDSSPATAANIAASGQGLLDQHVFHQALQMTRMPMALADPNLPDCPLVYVNPAFWCAGQTGKE
jgi:hypothetical protein